MTGTTTSDYVRASAVNAANYNNHCAFVEEDFFDHSKASHHYNWNRLFKPDIGAAKKLATGGLRTAASSHVFPSLLSHDV